MLTGARHQLAVFVATLGVYVVTMPRSITLEDAGLFQMVCHLGGIAHPPGYPLFTLLCNGMVHVPGVVNGNLVSALFASSAVALFHHICYRLLHDRVFAYVASLAWGFSAAFWSQAIIIEVYSLAALMFMVCWYLIVEFEQSRRNVFWFGACLAYGLALSNHWPLMILSSFGLLAAVGPALSDLVSRCRSTRFIVLSFACVLVGLLPYASLVLETNPKIAIFGPIESFDEFLRYVSRSLYRDDHATAGLTDKLQYALWLAEYSFVIQAGVLVTPLVLTGLVESFYVLPRHVAVSLLLVWAGSTYILLALINFEFSHFYRAIFKPYPVIAFSAIAFWLALGTRSVVQLLTKVTGNAKWLVSPVVILAIVITNYPKLDRSGATLIDAFGRTVLSTLPENAILFVSGDNETGPIGYLHHVEGVRPDIELRDWYGLVFENRISSPFGKLEDQEAANQAFINAATRPVVVLQPVIKPRIDFGAYVMFNPGGKDETAFLPEFAAFVDLLVDVYLSDLSLDDHEQYFLFYQLSRFSEHYVGYMLQHDNDIPPVVADGLARLQQTFPGRFVTLRLSLAQPRDQIRKDKLLAMAVLAEQDIPLYTPPKTRASFYEQLGRIHLLSPGDPPRAEKYLTLAVNTHPDFQNPAICLLASLYSEQGDATQADLVKARFPDAGCDEDGGED